jgi:hypothetical protein
MKQKVGGKSQFDLGALNLAQSSHVNWKIAVMGSMLGLTLLGAIPAHGQVNPNGTYNIRIGTDPNQPQTDRSYFTAQVASIKDGVQIDMDLWHGELNTPVSVYLQVAINNGVGNYEPVTIKVLETAGKHNSKNYHDHRTFNLSFKEINDALQAVLPAKAKHIKVGPGSPLVILSKWDDWRHTWGGIGRGGFIYVPEVPGQKAQAVSGDLRQPTELDIGYKIGTPMEALYNTKDANGVSVGLKKGGQIKSRLESEGKYQIGLDPKEAAKMTKRLFKLAELSKNDPAKLAQLLGPDWSIEAEMKYMKRDSNTGQHLLDANGLPIPDPMIDTYYDSHDSLGAQNDVALRYRWTEQNGEGAWNLKPGFAEPTEGGVVRRIEYGVETTDDKPETIKRFADSMDPLNPFRIIRELIPGATPSEFLHPSVKIIDTRYKFKLKGPNSIVIEVSVDNVLAESLRDKGKKVKYAQLEMDVDHPSAQVANVVQGANAFDNSLMTTIEPVIQQFLDTLDKKAFLEGRPVIHTPRDLLPSSPLLTKLKGDLDLTDEIIGRLRDDVIGKDWLPAPQKYSLAAVLLGHIPKSKASSSVKALFKREKELIASGALKKNLFEDHSVGGKCSAIFK